MLKIFEIVANYIPKRKSEFPRIHENLRKFRISSGPALNTMLRPVVGQPDLARSSHPAARTGGNPSDANPLQILQNFRKREFCFFIPVKNAYRIPSTAGETGVARRQRSSQTRDRHHRTQNPESREAESELGFVLFHVLFVQFAFPWLCRAPHPKPSPCCPCARLGIYFSSCSISFRRNIAFGFARRVFEIAYLSASKPARLNGPRFYVYGQGCTSKSITHVLW